MPTPNPVPHHQTVAEFFKHLLPDLEHFVGAQLEQQVTETAIVEAAIGLVNLGLGAIGLAAIDAAADAFLRPAIKKLVDRIAHALLAAKGITRLPEAGVAGRPLGRHSHLDPRSESFAVRRVGAPLVSRTWSRTRAALQQGELGSCTGNAIAGVLATEPFGLRASERAARAIYSAATRIDGIPGAWPHDDTGSTVLAAAKAAKAMGKISAYHWCFSIDDALDCLSHQGPLAVGVNWYEGFDEPDTQGVVRLAGRVRGGHAFEVLGVDLETQRVLAINSWGAGWGAAGRFSLSLADFEQLLGEQGEAVLLRPYDSGSPNPCGI